MPIGSRRLRCFIFLVLAALAVASSRNANATEQKYWELSPYRVRLHVAIDDSKSPQPGLAEQLVDDLKQQIRATVYPLWTTKIDLASGLERHHLLSQLGQLDRQYAEPKDLADLASGSDKQIYLTIHVSTVGIELHCREFDSTTRRWGAVQSRRIRQSSEMSAHCFDIVCKTFSPLATIRPLATDDNTATEKKVLLSFRGSDLPRQTDLSFLMNSGEVYQPLMVRTSSTGEVKSDSIREIPWTYLTLDQPVERGWRGDVHTGTRRPFGVRRRGRVEHLALALREPVGSTQVRFYARHNASRGLTGYEVFRREPAATESLPLGLTDTSGSVKIDPSESKVTLLFLRSEGQLLAKVPVVPGLKSKIDVPVADDTARLRAQAALTSLTERLIDTVAQRNILIARVRDRLKSGKIDQAQALFLDLDSLPGRAQFDQEIKSVENRKLNRSDDPKVQARIEKLFADTRKLLGRFLSTRQISEVQAELTAARRGKSS